MRRVSRAAAVVAFAFAACCLGALFVMVARADHSGSSFVKLIVVECAAIVLALAFEFRPYADELERKETQT